MSRGEFYRRSLVFLLSLWVNALGICLVTLAAMGTTPISSIWYEISLHVPLTFGTVTFIGNFCLIASQYFLLHVRTKEQWLRLLSQLPATLLFAASIDLNMFWLHGLIGDLSFYPARFVLLLAGTLILALGVAFEVKADVALVAGEAFVKALCVFLKKEFGLIKTCFDISLVISAVIIGLLCTDFTEVASVREGTLVGALLVGPTVRIVLPHLSFLDIFFKGSRQGAKEAAVQAASAVPGISPELMDKQGFSPVITISREYGCGGRVLGHLLAEKLNIDFYDSSIIDLVAQETGFSRRFVERNQDRLDNALLFEMLGQDYTAKLEDSLSSADALFVAGVRVVWRLAHHGPCVIVGRGADAVLRHNPYCLKVRLQAGYDYKLNYCMTEYHLSREQAIKDMQLFDKRRAEHYQHYFRRQVTDASNFDLVLNVEALGMEGCAKIITEAFKYRQKLALERAAA